MTNHWNDLANSDCILIMGSNPAENHPISFKWVLKAQDKGAKVVSVDPRFTHSSSKADFYVQLRVGTDIAFLGGMINYILNNDKYFKQYVIDSTNGPTVVGERFGFSDGLFSGFNADKKSYDKKTWAFEMDANGVPVRDETLTHPRCVLQLLKKHYDRYTLDKVSETTGTPKEDLLRVYETFASTGAPDKAGTIMYAMGWTQKSVGVQNIRAMSIIQLLLGNIGVAGGGVNALRGESNVQGSTDQALLADIWPGYLPVPTSTLTTLADYNATTPKTNDPKSVNWWGNRPKYTASFLMSLYPGVTPDVAKWGFPSFRGKGSIINARSETAAEKRSFRESLMIRRCVVPSTGFYEWDSQKQKHRFQLPGSGSLYMAGLYNDYQDGRRYVIMTTAANKSIINVHDRMPVIVPSDKIYDWITNTDVAFGIMRGAQPILQIM